MCKWNAMMPIMTTACHQACGESSNQQGKRNNNAFSRQKHLHRQRLIKSQGQCMAMAPALVVSELTREIENKPVIRDISFAVSKGEVLFIRGPSGVGKSILLRAIAALDPIQVTFIKG